MYDVITVGSATFDVFARTKFSELIKIIDPKGETDLLAFPSGSKILIEDLKFTTGGGGTNTATALARLGHKVAFLGKLGLDSNSDFIKKELKKEKVDLLCVYGRDQSGYSLILDTLEHDRTILTYKGINDQLKYSEIPYKKLKTKWFYFSSMLKDSFQSLEKLAEFAQKNNIKIAFNPSTYLSMKGLKNLKYLINRTELLILNKEEAELIVGREKTEVLLSRLKILGPRIVAITNGRNKLYVIDNNYIYTAQPTYLKVVDSTGAGDAFAASLLSGILKKNNMEFAIKLGMVNSESVVTHYGAKNILLTFNKAIKIMKKSKIKIKKAQYKK